MPEIDKTMPGPAGRPAAQAAPITRVGPAPDQTLTAPAGPPTVSMDKTSPPAAPPGPPAPPAPTAPHTPDNEAWKPLVVFHGKGSELLWILLQNFFFSLFTLGIYAFWGRTKQRAYLWSNTTVLGEPLEYTGTGKELFLGFLIVMPLLLLFMFAFGLLASLFPPVIFVLYLALLYAWQYASYRALRYRLTRTRWRGIRGNLAGKPSRFAWKAAGYMLAAFFSLGLAYPWATARITGLLARDIRFGDREPTFSNTTGSLYASFFLGIALTLGIACVLTLVATLIMFSTGAGLAQLTDLADATHFGRPPRSDALIVAFIPFLLMIAGYVAGYAFYAAGLFRWRASGVTFGRARTRSSLGRLRYVGIVFTNILLVICTVGFGSAWARIRGIRAMAHSLSYAGDPQIASLLQDTRDAPGVGEGLLEALDVDLGF